MGVFLRKTLDRFPGVKSRIAQNRTVVRMLQQVFSGETGRYAVRDRFLDMRQKINTDSPVIIDGGAHDGGVIDIFLKQFPNPKIYAFEPIPELAQGLRAKYAGKPNIIIHEKAIGSEPKTVSFNLLNDAMSSSILTPTEYNEAQHEGMMQIKKKLEVQQVRLDDILDEEIDILKLDLQGYEMDALKGCENLLKRTKIVNLEVEFVQLYEGQSLFSELELFLRERGFWLLNFYELYTYKNGQLGAGDVLLLNSRYFKR